MNNPLTLIAEALGITEDEAGRMTWPDLQAARARLVAERDAALAAHITHDIAPHN
jgi:hypothetical protein